MPLLSVSIGNFHAVETYSRFSILLPVVLVWTLIFPSGLEVAVPKAEPVPGVKKSYTSCRRVSSGNVYLPLSADITVSRVSSGGVVRGKLLSFKRALILARARSITGVAALLKTCSVRVLDALFDRSEVRATVVTTNKVTISVTITTVGNTKPATLPFLCPREAPNSCRTKRRLMRIGLPILFSHFLNLAINSAKKRLILRLCLESDITFTNLTAIYYPSKLQKLQ